MRQRFRRFLAAYVRVVQKILITVLLTLVYLLVMGLTFLVGLLFRFRVVAPRRRWGEESYWSDAAGYDPDPDESRRQS